jgi:hypothetical protein
MSKNPDDARRNAPKGGPAGRAPKGGAGKGPGESANQTKPPPGFGSKGGGAGRAPGKGPSGGGTGPGGKR